jgi:hypothetical protein
MHGCRGRAENEEWQIRKQVSALNDQLRRTVVWDKGTESSQAERMRMEELRRDRARLEERREDVRFVKKLFGNLSAGLSLSALALVVIGLVMVLRDPNPRQPLRY